jgi:hypothetical protein
MSAIYASTLTASDPLKIFKAGAEPDKLFLVNAYLSASSVRVAFSGGFEQEITNCPAVWFDFLIEPGTELWVQGTGDFKFIISRHPIVWSNQSMQNLLNPAEPTTFCTPVVR